MLYQVLNNEPLYDCGRVNASMPSQSCGTQSINILAVVSAKVLTPRNYQNLQMQSNDSKCLSLQSTLSIIWFLREWGGEVFTMRNKVIKVTIFFTAVPIKCVTFQSDEIWWFFQEATAVNTCQQLHMLRRLTNSFDSFNGGMCCPLSDNSPYMGHWRKQVWG
jgi:hypothetical protein